MSPESLIALLLFGCLFGLAGLTAGFYLAWRRARERFDSLSHLLDTLDERTIHEYTSMSKQTEEIRSRIEAVGKSLEEDFRSEIHKEREERSGIEAEIRKATEALSREHHGFRELMENSITPETRESIARLSEQHGQQAERLNEFESRVRSVRLRSEAQLALSHLTSGEAETAAGILENLIREDPTNREAVLLAGKANLQCGRVEKAGEVLTAGIERFPDDPDILADLARVRSLEGKEGERTELVERGLARSPNHPRLHFERALASIARKEFASARKDLEEVLKAGVETAEVRYNLGIAHVSMGQVPAGIAELRRSLALDPVSVDGNRALGLALLHLERYLEAVDFLERARDLKPDSAPIRLDLAAALRLSGSPRQALKECAIARQLNPRSGRAVLKCALAHHDLAEFKEALECLDNLLQWRPSYVEARRLKAQILTEIERLDEAVEEWSTLVQQRPDDPELMVSLGKALKKVGQPQAALGWLEIAARMSPDSHHIQLAFAREALAQGRLNLVQEVVDTAYPRAATAESLLQFLEMRLLLVLKFRRWILLDRILSDLKRVLTDHPEAIPLDKGIELGGEYLLNLGFSKEAQKIHQGLLDLYEGTIDYDLFDETVTKVMRSLLPPSPPPPPATPSVEATPHILVEGPDNGKEGEGAAAVVHGAPVKKEENERLVGKEPVEAASSASVARQPEEREPVPPEPASPEEVAESKPDTVDEDRSEASEEEAAAVETPEVDSVQLGGESPDLETVSSSGGKTATGETVSPDSSFAPPLVAPTVESNQPSPSDSGVPESEAAEEPETSQAKPSRPKSSKKRTSRKRSKKRTAGDGHDTRT